MRDRARILAGPMPIYEYRCEKGHTFDVMQSMSDDPLTACEVCGAPVQKVLHAPAVHFKGSGFYNTDYGKGGKSKSSARVGRASSKTGQLGSNGSSSSSRPTPARRQLGSSSKKSRRRSPARRRSPTERYLPSSCSTALARSSRGT